MCMLPRLKLFHVVHAPQWAVLVLKILQTTSKLAKEHVLHQIDRVAASNLQHGRTDQACIPCRSASWIASLREVGTLYVILS